MTDHKDDLLPCPFCGGANLQSGGVCFVGFWCLDCEAQGPSHYGRYEWNTRAAMVAAHKASESEIDHIQRQLEAASSRPINEVQPVDRPIMGL